MANKQKSDNAKKDGLYLLEVLVNRIVFEKAPCFADNDFRTCVSIKCLEQDPLIICDDEGGTRSSGPFVKNMGSGKSCLFNLSDSEVKKASEKFKLDVNVYKEMACGCLPTKIMLGKCSVDMTKEFVAARNSNSTAGLKDSFRMTGDDGKDCGEISLFLRISCYGKNIVTRFQGSSDPPRLGGGGLADDGASCNPEKDYQTRDDPCVCSKGKGGLARKAGAGGGGCSQAPDPYNVMPCQDPDEPCYCSGPKAMAKQIMACRNTDPYCLHIPKGRNKQFEEIGMNITGNELKIKVPAYTSIIKKISTTHLAMQKPFVSKCAKDTDGPCQPPCGKNQISLNMPCEASCCRGPALTDTKFICTTEGCLQASKHGQQLARKGQDQQLPPNVNVFVLKVAKTAMQGDRKCKLEMELVAPKGPDKDMPILKENRRLQSECCECCQNCSDRRQRRRYCCPPGHKVVYQVPTDLCGTGHRQRAQFNLNTDGVANLIREEPGQVTLDKMVYPKQAYKLRFGKTVEMPGRKTKLEYQFILPQKQREKVVPVNEGRTAQCICRCPALYDAALKEQERLRQYVQP